MSHINLCREGSPLGQWFRRDPTLATELGLATEHTHYGQLPITALTPAGNLLFGEGGVAPWLETDPSIWRGTLSADLEGVRQDREVRAWMVLEEGWSKKSWFHVDAVAHQWKLFRPAPLTPSLCKVLHHYLAVAGVVRHRTGAGFMSEHKLVRELVASNPTPVEHVTKVPNSGEMWMPAPRSPFHPFVQWIVTS